MKIYLCLVHHVRSLEPSDAAAKAALRYVAGCTKLVRLRLHNTVIYVLKDEDTLKHKWG
jgi:hypothetical protein